LRAVRATEGHRHRSFPLAIVAAGLLLGGCGSGGHDSSTTATSTASYNTLVDAGIHLLRLGNTKAAGQLFLQAIARNPADPVAHYNLGVVYQGAGDRRDALREYDLALRSNSRYVPALYNKAILMTPVNAPLAIFYYRQVIQIQPNSPTAFLNLGLLENQRKGLRSQALLDVKRAVRLDPSLRGRVPTSLRAEIG
jgi:tetratricopeptide (TPR) repeat protein